MNRLPPRAWATIVTAVLAAAALLAVTGRASSERDTWTVASPKGVVSAAVSGDGGALSLTVRREGRQVLAARLGGADPGAARVSENPVTDAYETPAGKRRRHELVARRLTLAFSHGRRLDVLVTDDGVAFRQAGLDQEESVWRAPAGAHAWLQSYRRDYEGHYDAVDVRAAEPGDYGLPALVDTGAGTWALLTESGLTREAAAHLTVARDRPGELAVTLPSGEAAPKTTPWRVAIVGDLPTVVGSDLAVSLGRPSQIRDTSWIRPGRVAWSWWSEPASAGDSARQRTYVRAAAAHDWRYVLLDDGWDARTVPGISRYAARKGRRILLWTAWDGLRDPAERERLFTRWAAWGVAGVKVDFLLSDSAARMAVYDDIARDAARHRLVVVFHGSTIPRGIQRTWPNVLTMEAVRGAEYETSVGGRETIDPRHEVNLVFTRNPIGSMDYTPVTFSAPNRDTTDAHRLALAVVYESGLQHFADSPEAYAQHPEATEILRDVPAAWDDTRLLTGAPDREATVARRTGAAWWVGSISATDARRQHVSLGFLDPGRSYRLHLVRDDGHGALAVEDRTVTTADELAVAVDRNGGFVARLTPL